MVVVCGLYYVAVSSVPNLFSLFIIKGCRILSDAFSASIDVNLVLCSFDVVYHFYSFAYGEPIHAFLGRIPLDYDE